MSDVKVNFVRMHQVPGFDFNDSALFAEGDDGWLYEFNVATGLWNRHSPMPDFKE